MATKSTFYADGFRDGSSGKDYSPPDVPIYAQEYSSGYVDGRHTFIADISTINEYGLTQKLSTAIRCF